MSRTKGAKNLTPFDARAEISTSPNADIKHLASSANQTVLEYFHDLLRHQSNYSRWIQTRHDELKAAKDELARLKSLGATGPKYATYRKYKWYSEYLVLLEAINAYEVFYKRSIIRLADAVRDYVPPDRLKGSIDARILWSAPPSTPTTELIFESQLYHDLDNVDKATDALIQAKRYNKNSPPAALKSTVRSLQAIFQIRHTLSHNHGLVTTSDAGKLKLLGYKAKPGEVLDPSKDDLGLAVNRALKLEAEAFTAWLLQATAAYLKTLHSSSGVTLNRSTLTAIEQHIGKAAPLTSLTWV